VIGCGEILYDQGMKSESIVSRQPAAFQSHDARLEPIAAKVLAATA